MPKKKWSPIDTRCVDQRHVSTIWRSVWYMDALGTIEIPKLYSGQKQNILAVEWKQSEENENKIQKLLLEK